MGYRVIDGGLESGTRVLRSTRWRGVQRWWRGCVRGGLLDEIEDVLEG